MEDATVSVAELAQRVGMQAAPEKVARFAGCFSDPNSWETTGKLPPRWAGQGMNTVFTVDEAREIQREWENAKFAAESLADPWPGTVPDPEFEAVADRYRP